ncbi:MAG: hypothetical protein Ct9H300mP7_5640 [Verrucomicrobiota bacterium]|nr:MAG: hypothetical protein Ct9H300mP7_5640 [Verrucomicrobiota bacterium]
MNISWGFFPQLWRLSLGKNPRSRSGLANPSTVRRLSVYMKQNNLYRVVLVRWSVESLLWLWQ